MDNNLQFNPLNIRNSNQKFVGEVESHNAFKAFQNFPYGIRAAGKILLTYYRQHGLNTIHGIVHRWAPPGDNNDTAAYEAGVVRGMGIGAFEPFKVSDRAELMLLIDSMAPQENPVKFTREELESGVVMALGLSPTA